MFAPGNLPKSFDSKGLRRAGGAPPPQKSSPIFDFYK